MDTAVLETTCEADHSALAGRFCAQCGAPASGSGADVQPAPAGGISLTLLLPAIGVWVAESLGEAFLYGVPRPIGYLIALASLTLAVFSVRHPRPVHAVALAGFAASMFIVDYGLEVIADNVRFHWDSLPPRWWFLPALVGLAAIAVAIRAIADPDLRAQLRTGGPWSDQQRLAVAIVAAVFALFAFGRSVADVGAFGMLSNDTSSGSQWTTGLDIEDHIWNNLQGADGTAFSSVSCPNVRLITGDSVICRVGFLDGSFRDVSVLVRSTGSTLDLLVDLA